jgi:hypothetical protein
VNYGNTQINVAPDGSPIFTRDTGYQEIYALNIPLALNGHTTRVVPDKQECVDESVLRVSGLFPGIGHIPNAKMFEGQIDLDEDGHVKTRDDVFTRVPAVFACGDVLDRRYRQAITAAGRFASGRLVISWLPTPARGGGSAK